VQPIRARNTAEYDAPIGLTADPVVFTLVDGGLSVLLARRLEEPQRGMFALPGGFVGADESPEQTAERKLREKTGVGSVHLEQLRTYASPRRDPRGWLPSIAYLALVRPEELPGGFVGASEAPSETAERKLREKTGVGSVHLEQLRTYADPARDPRTCAAAPGARCRRRSSRAACVRPCRWAPRWRRRTHPGARTSRAAAPPTGAPAARTAARRAA